MTVLDPSLAAPREQISESGESTPVLARQTSSSASAAPAALNGNNESVIFFTSDGLRQDLVETYAGQGQMPAIAKLLRAGARAAPASGSCCPKAGSTTPTDPVAELPRS